MSALRPVFVTLLAAPLVQFESSAGENPPARGAVGAAARGLAVALALLAGCRASGGGGSAVEPKDERGQGQDASEPCPRPAELDDPSRRVELAIPEPGFAYCDFQTYGPTEIADQTEYERVVDCGDPASRPTIDFETTRLFVSRVRAPSEVLGATREADGRILVHVHAPGICSGVDWGDAIHVVALPKDGSAIEVSACVEPSTCGPGVAPP